MIKITDNSSVITFDKLNTSGVDYYIAGDMYCIYEMNEAVANDLITKIDNKEMDDVNLIIFYLFDLYADIDKMKRGFWKLFDHLVFDNQWFLEHDICIFCPNIMTKNAISDTARECSRIITKTNKRWPEVNNNFIDTININERTRGRFTIKNNDGNNQYIQTLTDLTGEYYEVRLFKTFTDLIDELDIQLGYTSDNRNPWGYTLYGDKPQSYHRTQELENYDELEKKYYKIWYIQHHELKMETRSMISRFYGNHTLSMTSESYTGDVIFDIYNIKKKSKIALTNIELDQLINDVESSGGILNVY